MCIVDYIATDDKIGVAKLSFVVGKTRIARILQLSISKLELQAAFYSARMRSMIIQEHDIPIGKDCHWTESVSASMSPMGLQEVTCFYRQSGCGNNEESTIDE